MEPIKNRYDFLYIFDVQDGNPNGDPDAGNLPRMDTVTGEGLVSDVCLKRKIRNYVQTVKGCAEGYDIFIKEKAILNNAIKEACDDESVKKAKDSDKTEAARDFMCRKYFDVRTFGAVMSTGEKTKNAGQVRGPIQLTFGRSVGSIDSQDHAITRMAVASEEESKKQAGGNRTIGRKATVPYGLYVAHGFVSANLARQTGFSEDDLQLVWEALANMFDCDRSAARGLMSARRIIVFKHDSALGNTPANRLFDLVSVEQIDKEKASRGFADYRIEIDRESCPSNVEIIDMI